METVIALAAVTLLIALGARLIHRLNAQHDARIAAHTFGAPFPAIRRPPGHSHHTPTDPTAPTGQAARRRPMGTWP
ncbi:hypothetical protein PV371_24950 [Streptomyces sp. TX20-6-3]|uniref:hypothetical protein n=1 Tax=Streptomyces sp. TX20-6-3 TaxID=3028705 RepID=UPI0029A3E523|nr:hypothetical protein [Streptomyces sp. TX20-6-3]MDX2562884.1 hypothetical protein [Streptomyces sp. TX20-6-3]